MKILQKTVCHRDRKFREVTFENQGISGNSKKRGALNFVQGKIKTYLLYTKAPCATLPEVFS